jgi:hypothetical protein
MSKRWFAPILVLAWVVAPVATAAATDRDHDGLPDGWERRHHLSTHEKSTWRDPDHDGLSTRREFRLRTNPRRRDTDRDGLRDGREVKRYHTNPRKRDTDGDGWSDRAEVRAGTNPRKRSSHPAGAAAQPIPQNVGVPRGWVPTQTRSSDLVIRQAGAVVQDVLLTHGDLIVNAPNVTVRRVKLEGGRIINTQGSCKNGLVVEDSTFAPAPGKQYADDSEGMTGAGGYTARRVLIWRRQEGFRDGGKSSGCGPVTIEDSFAKIVIPPGCPGDPHSDGIQGYDGPPLTVRNVTIDFREASCGTAPFYVPANQGNTRVSVDGLLVMGGGATFRLGVPASVKGLKIVDNSWYYFPVEVKCSVVSTWDARIVRINSNYQVTSAVGNARCSGTGN